MESLTLEPLRTFYQSEVFVTTLVIVTVLYFLFAMLPNVERYRNWFNESQLRGESLLIIPAVLFTALAPLIIGLLVAAIHMRMEDATVPTPFLMLGATAITFVGQRLYAITFVD